MSGFKLFGLGLFTGLRSALPKIKRKPKPPSPEKSPKDDNTAESSSNKLHSSRTKDLHPDDDKEQQDHTSRHDPRNSHVGHRNKAKSTHRSYSSSSDTDYGDSHTHHSRDSHSSGELIGFTSFLLHLIFCGSFRHI